MFRTVVIKRSSKLQYIQGYMIIFDGENESKVFLSDISLLIIETTGCVITVPLIIELVKQSIAIIFCDEKHNPTGTLLGFNNNYQNAANIYRQIDWKDSDSDKLWQLIIKAKVQAQIDVLRMFNKEKVSLLEGYLDEIYPGDNNNREGLAAKVYFFELFGHQFNRSEQNVINGLLDYGYAMILSCFNREITAYGYLTQLGIHHRGKTNPFNLASDFMEPFRPICDIFVVLSLFDENPLKRIRKMITKKIIINQEERYLDDAIGIYVIHMVRYLNRESIEFPQIKFKEKSYYVSDESDENDNYV